MGKKKRKTQKKKKEKVVYYDDGSSITDMSDVKQSAVAKIAKSKSKSSYGEKLKTFWAAFKMMLIPTFIALTVLFVLYLLLSLLAK